jgi:hypothetical protein
MLALVKAFVKAGVLSEDCANRQTITGAPQGGILSSVLANARSVLDEQFAEVWESVMSSEKTGATGPIASPRPGRASTCGRENGTAERD